MTRLLEWLPRGNTLDDASFRRRHLLLQWVLAAHMPVLAVLGWWLGNPILLVLGGGIAPIAVFLLAGHFFRARRPAASFITAGLVWCSITLVAITHGTIEAHFHFFIIIGFIALYQDWVPFLLNVVFTGVSHVVGTIFWPTLIFNHPAAQQNPWLWSGIHAFGVLLACVGMVIFWRITEDEQNEKEELGRSLVRADAEIGRRQFTSDMLVNLARRNQSMLYRQLDIINQLEEKEQDPDALSELFKLDHLATRVRRNAESLLVLSGEQPPRVWSAPVSMRDVVRAAIAETEDLERVEFSVDDRTAVAGHSVADLTHLLAELTENAVRFSPPDTSVTIRSRPQRPEVGGQVLTIEDWGVGMPADELAAANELLVRPREVDLSVSQRLGFHVVARLAQRHNIEVSLSTTPGSGLTAVVILPAALFVTDPQAGPHAGIGAGPEQTRRATAVHEQGVPEHARRSAVATAERPELPGLAGSGAADSSFGGPGFGAPGRERSGVERSDVIRSDVATGNGNGANAYAGNGHLENGNGHLGNGNGGHLGNGNGHLGNGGNGNGNGAAHLGNGDAGQGNGRGNGHLGNGNGHNGNGHAGNGHNGNGHAGNGHAGNGGPRDGYAPNGSAPSGANGSAAPTTAPSPGTGNAPVWTPPAARPVPGPGGPAGRGPNWSGWWDPAPADRAGRFAGPWGANEANGSPEANGANGQGTGGRSDHGSHDSGSHDTGSHDRGQAANGRGSHANGQGANGQGANGQGANGRADVPSPEARTPGNGYAERRADSGYATGAGHPNSGGYETAHAPAAARSHSDDHAAEQTDDRSGTAIPTPRPAPAEASAPPSTGSSGLRRRVPQASLAPELRAETEAAEAAARPAPATPAGPSADAAQALSRYQASRQAAQAVAGHEGSDHRRTNP